MSKIISISIDLNSITPEKVKPHANGAKYYNMTVMERKEADEYGNTHYVIEQQTKDEREAKAPKNYLKSSGKEFTFSDNDSGTAEKPQPKDVKDDLDDYGLPF